MSDVIDLDSSRHTRALRALAHKYRLAMKLRWPAIDFDADEWRLNQLYQTTMLDTRFHPMIVAFAHSDPSYLLALRCLVAEATLEGYKKSSRNYFLAWRLLQDETVPLTELRREHLTDLEEKVVSRAKPASAQPNLASLSLLSTMLATLAQSEVVDHFAWTPSAATKDKLRKLRVDWQIKSRSERSIETLDRKVEALSDATRAMLLRDERLSNADRSAIAVCNILMCAPSRINEPLCMRITDRYKIDDFAKRPDSDNAGTLYQAHQLLLMKGSKGADWSAKPILNFMIKLSEASWNIILESGHRSRTLVKHYENHPDLLYLPQELEHLRGKPVTKNALWQITNLTAREPTSNEVNSTCGGVWDTFLKRDKSSSGVLEIVENPRILRSDGQKNGFPKIPALAWPAVEEYLLERVRQQMDSIRRVTQSNRYHGPLSEMLMLVDIDRTPYLPRAWNDNSVRARLKDTPWRKKQSREKSVFVKLGLQMIQNDELINCYVDTHDLRRWLTTQALDSRERLSDVLINKWANRVNISQLAAYDLRSPKKKADQVALPVPNELNSITSGLQALEGIEEKYGLSAEIAIVQGDPLAITSVDAVLHATENRPVARSGDQIIILYPNRYGICLHQHHETPCRAYSGCSDGCNEQLTVKGHLPTNEEWRKQEELTSRSIINQLEALITARQRGISDDPAALDAHLLLLAKGINAQTMAVDLIERFHEIKERIQDLSFRNELEAAYVSRGIVTRLDDQLVPDGAIIKYHNPARHASPGFERGIEAQCGGREEMQRRDSSLHQRHPELAPTPTGLRDDRRILSNEDISGEGTEE